MFVRIMVSSLESISWKVFKNIPEVLVVPTSAYQYQPVPTSADQSRPVLTSADKYRLVPTNVEASKSKLKCLKVKKSFFK